jgi:hypothetical protein
MERGIYLSSIIIIVLVLIGLLVSFFTGIFLVPLIPTPKEIRGEILEIMKLKTSDMLLDLGSGNGIFLIEANRKHGVKGIGYEISPLGIFTSRVYKTIKLGFKNDIAIVANNFLNLPIPKTDKIYCYLNTKALRALKEKFVSEEISPTVEIYSYRYCFPDVKYEKKIELSNKKYLFVYKGHSFFDS